MLKMLADFFCGMRRLSCDKDAFPPQLNAMAQNGIKYRRLTEKDGRVFFTLSEREYKRLLSLTDSEIFTVELRKGLPYFLERYKRRYGLIIGALIFLILTKLSTVYVWDISVEGNDTVSDAEVLYTLEKLGFSVGSYIPDVDFYNICHEFILENENVSWISVNMEGTSARVKLIEADKKGDNGSNGTPSNLVAKIDGIIVRTETANGEVCVKAGEAVKKGQLLISGVVEIGQGQNTGRYMLTRSEGRIYAMTERILTVEVALSGTETVQKDAILAKKTLKFFGKSIKLKENSSILQNGCDIIKEERRVVLFEGAGSGWQIPLPVEIISEYVCITEEREYSYTEDEARAVAENKMAELYASELSDVELLYKIVHCEVTDNTLILSWTVRCIEDIGLEAPIGLV